jgi:hypothetical protein
MQSIDCKFAASAVTAICCVCLLTFLKSIFRSECIKGFFGPSGSIVRPAVTSCLVASALAFVANVALLFNTRSKLRTLAAAICSKWQPAYFITVSVQKIILKTIVIPHAVFASNNRVSSCALSTAYENQIHIATFVWNCVILLAGVSTICCDADSVPILRRSAYCLLALCLLVDATGSYIWGNVMASEIEVSFSVGSFNLIIDNQITSCITSQAIIALHFLYVSCRSHDGRGWWYPSLRFELDDCAKDLSTKLNSSEIQAPAKSSTTASESTPMTEPPASQGSRNTVAEISNALSKMRLRWLQFQNYHVSRCRVFVIPCVVNTGIQRSSDPGFTLLRPAFDLRFLRPLQRLADAHPKYYISFIFWFLAIPSLACAMFFDGVERGSSSLVLNTCMVVVSLGFLSSRRFGLDRVAVNHVASSFRFVTCSVLLAALVAIHAQQTYNGVLHATQPTALAVLALLFFECALLDCSPHLSKISQILVSVTSCIPCPT